jgi:conjugal transfer pilus assembly protein TraD
MTFYFERGFFMSKHNDQQDIFSQLLSTPEGWFLLVSFLYFFPSAIVMAITLILWRMLKFSWWPLLILGGVLFSGGWIAGYPPERYFQANVWVAMMIFQGHGDQLPYVKLSFMAIPPGLILSGLLVGIAGYNQHVREKIDRISRGKIEAAATNTLVSRKMNAFVQRKVQNQDHPADGVLLGTNTANRKPVMISDHEFNQHGLLVGTTGSGKTVTIMNIAESAISRQLPLIYVDGKGDLELARKIQHLATSHQRPFYLFSMMGTSMKYNPLATGGYTALKDKLISLSEWTEEHYKKMAERYLQTAFKVFQLSGIKPTLATIGTYLDPDDLMILARSIEDEEQRQTIMNSLDKYKVDQISGLAARIATMTESEIGHLFEIHEGDSVLELQQAVAENAVVFFSLQPLAFPEYANQLGKLIVTDLKGIAAQQFSSPNRKKIYTIFDEFSVFVGDQVINLINQGRGAGIHAILATQSLSDIEKVGGKALVDQVLENCNVYMIQRQNSPENAETLATVIGTRDAIQFTAQISAEGSTGMGSARQTKEFIFHPDELKRLGKGEAIVVKKENFSAQKVNIRYREGF